MDSGQWIEVDRGQIDCSTAIDRASHNGIGYWRVSVVNIDNYYQTDHVMVGGCQSKLVNVVSWVPQGSVFGPLLILLYTSELFSIL